MARPSLDIPVEHSKNVNKAKTLQAKLEQSDLQLVKKVTELNMHEVNGEDGTELDNREIKDPAIVSLDVVSQISYLRKLKFQYLEQNAKDKYVKSIVSDIDDAPIVTAEDNKALALVNEEKKEKLKVAKTKLAEVQNDIRLLAPMVEKDYLRVKHATDRAAFLSQKIIEARRSLLLLRQTHPQPRFTIPLADQKLADQVEEMQQVSDEVQAVKHRHKSDKARLKEVSAEVEDLRIQAADAEKAVKMAQVDEDDSRLIPLYEWYTASIALHSSISNLEESHSSSENELRLTYKLDSTSSSPPHRIGITLLFAPDTRQLADAQIIGLEELGAEIGDLIDAHVQVDDVHGLVAGILMRARAALAA
ncbi:hypothetical protein CPB83DRAFT_797617 [Crepidotus variabilis]|uniref:Kinetochore protein Sos7 coiled-coil domain-containing protein n=1 Tax=Crepidotus variabilis TaxID=179855 RepID=A0A9P6E8W8_9AGAR|nr:hypothetical protein CPB83DRAFT_797617 [Crepidotus variabilis]